MQLFQRNQGKIPSWKRPIITPVLSWNSLFLMTSYPNITFVRTATKTSYFLSSTQDLQSFIHWISIHLFTDFQCSAGVDCADPPAQRGLILEWMYGLDAELKTEMWRAGQADSGCEHWGEEKEIKRCCRMKIQVDKRKKTINTKGRVGKTLQKKKVSMEKRTG